MQPINTHNHSVSPEYAHRIQETREAQNADAPQQTDDRRNPEPKADAFRHEAPESPGKYWVAPGPTVRFEPPTTAKAEQDTVAVAADSAPAQSPDTEGMKPESGTPKTDPHTNPDKDDSPEKEKEITICNTDSVDQEIEALRQKQKTLQTQASAADDTEAQEIQKELANVERELAMKDNDSYRRAHASFTTR